MQHDAWFFVGVFAFIFVLWFAIGGPSRPLSFSGPTLSPPQELGGGSYLLLPRAPFGIGGSYVSLPGSSEGGGGGYTQGSSDVPSPSSLSGVAFGTPSPYRGLVTFNRYVNGAGTNPESEYIQLYVSQRANTPIEISGWRVISSATGRSLTIPKGTETPISGTVNETQDITLSAGDTVYLTTGRSPIGGSFRENKCIAYFAQFQKFSPTLPLTCPVPSDELKARYSNYIQDPSCIEYVNKIPRCQVTLSPPVQLSQSCETFIIDTFNYNSCRKIHENDRDFLGTTWRVYLGSNAAAWRTKNEVIKLLDEDGKTVDAFAY